jgi:hypothetical protein
MLENGWGRWLRTDLVQVPSLHPGLGQFFTSGTHALCHLLPHWTEPIGKHGTWVPRLSQKRHCSFLFALSWSLMGNPMLGGYSSSLVESSEQASCQQPIPTCRPNAWAISRVDPPGQARPGQLTAALTKILHITLFEPEIPRKVSQIPDPQKLK